MLANGLTRIARATCANVCAMANVGSELHVLMPEKALHLLVCRVAFRCGSTRGR